MQAGTLPVATRRNGKQQACEPCRRRKVACNHAYPVCDRCIKRGQQSTCVYVSQRPPSRSSRPLDQRRSVEHLGDDNTSGLAHGLPFSSSGYLGPTSISAVLQDTQSALARETRSMQNASDIGTKDSPIASVKSPPTVLSESQIQRAISTLQQLPCDERKALELFRQNVSPNDGFIRMVGEKLIVTTWQTFETHLSDRNNLANLREMVEHISSNTARHLTEIEETRDPSAWLETFSGRNLRWESLAIIFAYLAFGEVATSFPGEESNDILVSYKAFCSLCISFGSSNGSANTLLIYALYKRSIIDACIYGDASLAYWKDHAEAVAMLTFLGIHVRTNPTIGSYQPTALSELRRRLFCQIFIMDKVTATFAGRPPLLAYKYCTTPLPLDLDDSALLPYDGNGEQEPHSIGPDGWSTTPKLRASTILRARTMMAIVREEILDIALGRADSHPIDQIIQLKTRELKLFSKIPAYVVYDASEDSRQMLPTLLWTKLLIRIEHLLNLFFIERLLALRSGTYGMDLLSVSFEMMSLTLMFWTHKDRLAGFQSEFQLFVIGYGAPAAGVLCNELMTQNPVLGRAQSESVAGMRLSRSSIIQQLSFLIGFLDWVGPAQPNSDLARTVKGIIQRVLDLKLSDAPMSTNIEFDVDRGMDEFFNFDLLDTFEWLRNETGVGNMVVDEVNDLEI